MAGIISHSIDTSSPTANTKYWLGISHNSSGRLETRFLSTAGGFGWGGTDKTLITTDVVFPSVADFDGELENKVAYWFRIYNATPSFTGIQGPTGPAGIGTPGNSALPYEPYNQNIMLSEWPLSNTYIWYVQFTCPSTANYKNLQFFCTPASTPTYNGTLGVAIYSNSVGQPGTPNSLIASGTQTFTNANMDYRYVDISFSSEASLEAHKLYWVAIAGTHNSGELIYSGFHIFYTP